MDTYWSTLWLVIIFYYIWWLLKEPFVFCQLQSVQCQTPWFDLQDFIFHSVLHWNFSWTSMPCLLPKNLKKSKQHYFWDNNLCEGVVLGKIEKKLEFNLILPIISILLKALRQLIQWKLGFITSAVWACPLLTLRRKGNSYNNIANSISILITTVLLQALKKII